MHVFHHVCRDVHVSRVSEVNIPPRTWLTTIECKLIAQLLNGNNPRNFSSIAFPSDVVISLSIYTRVSVLRFGKKYLLPRRNVSDGCKKWNWQSSFTELHVNGNTGKMNSSLQRSSSIFSCNWLIEFRILYNERYIGNYNQIRE